MVTTQAGIALPTSWSPRNLPKPVSIATPFGTYSWSARAEAGKLVIEEALSIPQQRVQPDRYAAFAAFARDVDQTQSQELAIAR